MNNWDKSGLEEFYAAQDETRRADDIRKLARLFNEAAKSPALREALAWAAAHGIDFIVDRKFNAAGMYMPGQGILALSEKILDEKHVEEAVGTLAHELRHAWQDWHGLQPYQMRGFTTAYIAITLMEADAEAFGLLAEKQWKLAASLEKNEDAALRRELDATVVDSARQLWQEFARWYEGRNPEIYGLRTISGYAEHLGLAAAAEQALSVDGVADSLIESEFNPAEGGMQRPTQLGLKATTAPDLAPLGAGFDGRGNYFDAAPSGFIDSHILSKPLAEAFYKAGAPAHPVVAAVNNEIIRRAEQRMAAGLKPGDKP